MFNSVIENELAPFAAKIVVTVHAIAHDLCVETFGVNEATIVAMWGGDGGRI